MFTDVHDYILKIFKPYMIIYNIQSPPKLITLKTYQWSGVAPNCWGVASCKSEGHYEIALCYELCKIYGWKEVVKHEICHVIEHIKYGFMSHDEEFQRCCKLRVESDRSITYRRALKSISKRG